MGCLGQFFRELLDLFGIFPFQGFFQIFDGLLDIRLGGVIQFVSHFLD